MIETLLIISEPSKPKIGEITMNGFTLPRMSIVVAATIGIASVGAPSLAAPGYYTGMVGSGCAAIKSDFAKILVWNAGAITNKDTRAPAAINCPLPIEAGTYANVYVTYNKKDSGILSCTFHRRSFDNLSGSTSSKSTTYNGSSSLYFSGSTDYFNSVQCSIPKATGTTGPVQNAVNGVTWYNY